MDDCCAVCAEPLEWVAYGSCGHREVCSTCVVRLRFILNDKKCCLCKIESPIVFVTKALGDYTRTIGDFSTFPTDAAEGPVGKFWYHEDTQAFFDDSDHYKMIKAMCRLSCSVCDRSEEEQKRKAKFRNVEQLKGHLFHRHKLLMCSLCLEGRKVFICEQKLYTRAQLNQHIGTGDSEVDGTESERGGFMGHPMCEFCRNPFYGDNELYMHMSTEHYTCHICQRQHPGQYDYYKNYDDLEIHFRNEHFLCENEACLGKKFIVFQSESEMKRHNAIEHGGHMSRSKRNAVLQIPTSFRYRRNGENDQRRGRGRGSRTDSSANQLSLAIQASFEMANPDSTTFESSSSALPVPNPGELSDSDPPMNSFDLLTVTSDVEPHSRYLQAVSQSSRNGRLEESSFPPLAVGPSSSITKPSQEAESQGKNTMAARLRQRNKGTVTVLNSAQRPWSGNGLLNNSLPIRPMPNAVHVSSSSGGSAQSWPAINDGLSSSSSTSSSQVRPATDHGHAGSIRKNSGKSISTSKGVSHSISAPNLVASNSGNSQQLLKVDDVHNANKSLVERIRDGLGMDENKYAAFKEISSEFRQGEIGTWEYLAYVEQFGLSHLVLELARLCPDPRKQRELIETYNANVLSNRALENGRSNSASSKEVDTCTTAKGKSVENSSRKGKVKSIQNGSSKGKGESVDPDAFSKKDTLADSIIDSVRELQANYKPLEEVEVLSKDGYRGAKGRLKVEDQVSLGSSNKQVADSRDRTESSSNGSTSNQNLTSGGANSKQRRKTSKFHRVRLGDGSAAALLDRRRFDASPEGQEESEEKNDQSEGGLSARGVWRNGGGQRLVALTQKDHPK